eukprot:gb/GEZN01005533.1/.p1 GENE.gb/GEZN01005533.1/~~gb/GEZN01005533.1/.p1  ORF type:complete len:394 (+),score=80.97 gb/GEZN01005533.1/:129-1310(+)
MIGWAIRADNEQVEGSILEQTEVEGVKAHGQSHGGRDSKHRQHEGEGRPWKPAPDAGEDALEELGEEDETWVSTDADLSVDLDPPKVDRQLLGDKSAQRLFREMAEERRLSLDTTGRRFSLFEDCEVIPSLAELQKTMLSVGVQMQTQIEEQNNQMAELHKEMKRHQAGYEAELMLQRGQTQQDTQELLKSCMGFVSKNLSMQAETIEGHEETMGDQLVMIAEHQNQSDTVRILMEHAEKQKQQLARQNAKIEAQRKEIHAHNLQTADLNKKTFDAIASLSEVAEKMRQALLEQRDQINHLNGELKKTQDRLAESEKAFDEKLVITDKEVAKTKSDVSKVKTDLGKKISVRDVFIIRSLNQICIEAHQRFWKGEKMVIDRLEKSDARDPEDWR